MPNAASTIKEAVRRLEEHDATLQIIDLDHRQHTDTQLSQLVDLLLARPDAATGVYLEYNQLTDATGAKLASYLAASTALQELYLGYNRFTDATHFAVAEALCLNTSLKFLSLDGNDVKDRPLIDDAFVHALRVNPRHDEPVFWMSNSATNEIDRLQPLADQLGHPSMQSLLHLLL